MAIYISGVRNLPEQVQKNKDDIEDLQTADTNLGAKINQEIADRKALIDSGNDTIISVGVSSIVANEDVEIIGVLEASGNIKGHSQLNIDSHITAGGEITAVGDITSSGDITANGDITSVGDITTDSGDIKTDAGNITTATGNIYTSLGYVGGLAVKTTIINVPAGNHTIQVNCPDSSNVNHVLKFDADTLKLTIDGQGIGKTYYQHHMALSAGTANQYVMLDIITNDPTPMTKNDLANYINSKGYTSQGNPFTMSAYIYIAGNYRFLRTLYATNSTTLQGQIFDENNGNSQVVTITNIIDQVL